MTFFRALQESAEKPLRVAAAVLAVILISILTFVPLSQNDFWLQAAVGRIIVQTGEIPRTVLFPFTWAQDSAFYPHEWLPSIAFHFLLEMFDVDHFGFVLGTLGLILFGLCLGLAFRLSRSVGAAILFACMAMAVANYRHYLRPEIFGLLLFVVELHWLTHYQRSGDRRILIWGLPLAIVWANTHGSFVIGPIVVAIFSLGEAIEAVRRDMVQSPTIRLRVGAAAGLPYLLAALVMALVSLANPLGPEVYRFIWAVSSSETFKRLIMEWRPTFSDVFMVLPGFWIFMVSLAMTLAVMVTRRRRINATDTLLLLAFLLIAVTRLRYVAWFGFVAMVVCSRLVGAGPWRPGWERAAVGTSAIASAIGIALAVQFGNAYGAYTYYAQSFNLTEPMIGQLSKPGVKGNVFNSYELGAELIYRGYPRLRPSMDSRADSYGEDYFLMHNNFFLDEPVLSGFLADYDVRYILVTWRDFGYLKKMPTLRDAWKIQFADHKAVLLVRRSGTQQSGSVTNPEPRPVVRSVGG